MTKKIWLVVLFLITCRFFYLDRFPIGMSHDEIEYILSAKTYFLMGNDLSGSHFPISIFQTKTEGVISFLPSLISSFYFGLVPINQTTTRIPYVLINLMTAGVLYLLIKKIFRDKRFGLTTALIFLINPWSFYLSRTATDVAFSLLFYLLGILMMVDDSKKKIWWGFVFLVLGFFSYHGAKVIFIPLIMVVLGYKIWGVKTELKTKNYWWILVAGIGIMFLYFGIGGKFFNQSVNQTRSGDIWILDKEKLADIVNTYRKTSLESNLNKLFLNKATVAAEIFFQKYLTAFSPEVLFISGDTRGTYRFGNHGLFYITDLVFILIGLIFLYKKYTNKTILLLFLAIISPLATAVSGVETSIINRSFLLLPVLVIFSSFGILTVYEVASKKIGKVVCSICLIILGLWLFFNFLFFYFFRWPITGQENYFFSQKIVANYISRVENKKIIVVDAEPREIFLETVFYSKNKDQNWVLKDFVKNQKFILGNTSFIDKCPESFDKNTIYVVNRTQDKCLPKNGEYLSINEEQFGGPLYFIRNDSLCSKFKLQSWLRSRFVKDYAIEKLDDENFCHNWIKQQI